MMNLRCMVFLIALVGFVPCATSQPSTGRVSGTVGFVSPSGESVEVAPFATVRVEVGDLRGEFTADDLGDFDKRLPPGRYSVTGVIGCRGQKLELYEKQVGDFEVLPNGFKRFDVMVKASEQEYLCNPVQQE